MDDFDHVLQVIDPWLDKFLSQGAGSLSALEAAAVGIWLLDTEVNNGGFDQYFFNTRGVLAEKTVHALREIGAHETASLLEAANKDVLQLPLPEEREACSARLAEIAEWSRFRALEVEYYEGREDRIHLLAAYLRRAQNDA